MTTSKSSDHLSKLEISKGYSPRITLIGCGAIAEMYFLPALAKHEHILKTLTIVDRDFARVKKMSDTFGVRQYFTDYRDVLDKTDGAIIALPTHLHHPVSMEFLARGVHVLCEKPLAECADKAREMVAESIKTGAVLATNYSQRLWPQFAKVKELIDDRSLGRPTEIKYYVGEIFRWPTVSGFYFNSIGAGRGVLRDRGAHVMDHICWWLGGMPKVISSLNDSFGGSESVANVKFEFNGCLGDVKLSWLSSFPCKYFVKFERGSIEGEVAYPQSVLLKIGIKPQLRVNLKSESYMALGNRIVSNFIGAVVGNEKPLVPASEILDSISFIDECYETATRFEMPWYEIREAEND